MQEPNAILAINSLDRYITNLGGNANQPFANYIVSEYNNSEPYSNDFMIQSPGALIYGYITRIIVSQIQIQNNIPTVCNRRNDRFFITIDSTGDDYPITIPFGHYSPEELASTLDTLINAVPDLQPLEIEVTYVPRDGFRFESKFPSQFYFPSIEDIRVIPGETEQSAIVALKAYRLLGLTITNSEPDVIQVSNQTPNFLYTPYIDFYSDILTNYQSVKDTNTSVAKPKGLIARVYLSGNGNVQNTTPARGLGTEPSVVTADLNSPKVIRWTRDVAVPSIDFQLRDCYGDFIPGPENNVSTEWQMTLLCVEGADH